MTNEERMRRIDILARGIRMLVDGFFKQEWLSGVRDFSWGISMLASMPAPWLEANDAQFQEMEFRAAEIIAAREKQRMA